MSEPDIRPELEEQADMVVDYTIEFLHNEDREYFRPHTEKGIPDFELMLDFIGLEVGAIYELRSEKLGDTRGIVTERPDRTVNHVEEYTVERGGLKSMKLHAREGDVSWDKMMEQVIVPKMDDHGASPVKWWQAYLQGRLEVIGHIGEVGDGWPDRSE